MASSSCGMMCNTFAVRVPSCRGCVCVRGCRSGMSSWSVGCLAGGCDSPSIGLAPHAWRLCLDADHLARTRTRPPSHRLSRPLSAAGVRARRWCGGRELARDARVFQSPRLSHAGLREALPPEGAAGQRLPEVVDRRLPNNARHLQLATFWLDWSRFNLSSFHLV